MSDSGSDEKIALKPVYFDLKKGRMKIESIIHLNNLSYDVGREINQGIKNNNGEKLYNLINYCPHRFTPLQLSRTLGIFIKYNHIEGARSILIHTRLSPQQVNMHCQIAVRENKPDMIFLFVKFLTAVLNSNTQRMVLLYLVQHSQDNVLSMFFAKVLLLDFDCIEEAMMNAVKIENRAVIRVLFQQNKIEWPEGFLERLIERVFTHEQDNVLSYIVEYNLHLIPEEKLQDLIINAYKNNFMNTVNNLGENYSHLITSKTRGKLLLLSIEYNELDLMRGLLDTEIDPEDRFMAYQIIFAPTDVEATFLTDKSNNLIRDTPKSDEDKALEEETMAALTFMFTQFTLKDTKEIERVNKNNTLFGMRLKHNIALS